jgi:putative ABC transport system substrate-binding protein
MTTPPLSPLTLLLSRHTRRREFITLLGGAVVSWPLAARAQQAGKLPTIGFLGPTTPAAQSQWVIAFLQRLRELGWVEGRTFAIEYRWAEGHSERFAEIATEFVRLKVDVIVTYGTPQVIAAKQATSVIPIVFALAGDPVGTGLIASLARPGGNVTGLSLQMTDSANKRIELLREVLPGLRRLAILVNVDNPNHVLEMGEVHAAARTLGVEVATLEIRRTEDIAPAIEAGKARADALYIVGDALFNANSSHQHFGGGRATADDLRSTGVRRCGRPDILWTELPGPVPARCWLRRQDSARGEACGPPGRAADQIRPGHQPDNRQGARPHRAANTARPRRRGHRMKRREFITLIGGAAAAWPLPARAQQPIGRLPRIGIIDDAPIWDHFRQGLRDHGYIGGQNVAIEYRSGGSVNQLRQAALELASLPTDVIVVYGSPGTRAAQLATTQVPIVMIAVGDPVRAGFVTNLARPDGNITGTSALGPDLIGKRVEILKECVPGLARVAFLWNPDNDSNLAFLEELIIAVPALGLQLISVPMRTINEFDRAFGAMMQRRPNAFVTTADGVIQQHIGRVIDFMATHRLPAIYQTKENAVGGGLMAYGATLSDLYKRSAWYVHRILQGAKPADLPVEQPTKFELTINLKTARALGLEVPPTLLARADEVIE